MARKFRSKCAGKELDSCRRTRKCKVASGKVRRHYCRSKKNRPRYSIKVRNLRGRELYVN